MKVDRFQSGCQMNEQVFFSNDLADLSDGRVLEVVEVLVGIVIILRRYCLQM
jgi:hypothetical protein